MIEVCTTSFLVGQVTFLTSCLTCLKNCIGLTFAMNLSQNKQKNTLTHPGRHNHIRQPMHLGSMPLTYEIISHLSIKYSLFIQIIPDLPDRSRKFCKKIFTFAKSKI